MTLSNFDIQRVLRTTGKYRNSIDGDLGPASQAAINSLLKQLGGADKSWQRWNVRRRGVAAVQLVLRQAGFSDVGPIDGLPGMLTVQSYSDWDNFKEHGKRPDAWRPDDVGPEPGEPVKFSQNEWGSQKEMTRRFGPAGGPQCTAGKVHLPFIMRIAWDKRQTITQFSCHEEVARSVERVYQRVAAAYDSQDIRNLGLDLFGGCYNFRKKRGGNTLSTHAFGVAVDTDPDRNRLRWGADRARLAADDCLEFWRCWEAENWVSLGRAKNFDWMHVQAPGV